MTEISDIVTLKSFGLLVEFSSKCWTATKRSRKAAQDAEVASHITNRGVIKAQKSLLAGNDRGLKRIRTQIEAARQTHYARTLPWQSSNRRLLSNALWPEYIEAMEAHSEQIKQQVSEFVAEYPRLISLAQSQLGDLFDPGDYPLPLELPGLFGIDYEFSTVDEVSDFQSHITSNWMIEQLEARINARSHEVMHAAMAHAWSQLYEMCEHLVQRTSDAETMKHSRLSLIDNARETVRILRHLNVTDDPDMERMRSELDQALAGVDATQLKNSESKREEVHGAVAEALETMRQFIP